MGGGRGCDIYFRSWLPKILVDFSVRAKIRTTNDETQGIKFRIYRIVTSSKYNFLSIIYDVNCTDPIILFLHGYKFNSFLLFNQMKTYIFSLVFVKFWILSFFIKLLNFSMFRWIWGRRIFLPKKVNPIIVQISKYFSIYTRPKFF